MGRMSTPYASVPDVVVVLGKIGPRIETAGTVNLGSHLSIAHTEALDRLHVAYGRTLPVWAGDGLESVRWAEAKLAAAAVLDILRASLDTAAEIPERLRRSAWAVLDGGVPGYPVGDPPGGTGGAVVVEGVPLHSSTMPLSNFADPYALGDVPTYAHDPVTGWTVT
jgi:hypothetical protein